MSITHKEKQARFDELYREYVTLYWRRVSRLGVGAGDIEDVMQDGWFKIWVNMPEVLIRANLCTWGYTVMSHTAIDFLRRGGKNRPTLLPLDTTDHDFIDQYMQDLHIPDPLDVVLAHEEQERVTAFLARLRPVEQESLTWMRADLSYEQINTRYGRKVGTAKSQRKRAIEAARKIAHERSA